MTRTQWSGYGPNTAAVASVLDHAAVMLPAEARILALAMTASWSWGRADRRFPPFVTALGSACRVAVSSGRVREVRAARAAVDLPPTEGWEPSAPVALVGVRITVAALVVADLLEGEQRALLLRPWRSLGPPAEVARTVAWRPATAAACLRAESLSVSRI